MEFIDLDKCVINALELFQKENVPSLHLNCKRPLVVGSGNAAVTGRIIFEGQDALFADEGTYENKMKFADGALLISASGGKHAPVIAKKLKENNISVTLLTCNKNASAKDVVDEMVVSPKLPEPYTYNTSTYMGMIISKTKEDPKAIQEFIENQVKPNIPKNLSEFSAFYILVPTMYDNVRELFMTKFDELFGPKVNGRVFTPEQTKHAKTVIPDDKELFISLGYNNEHFGKHKYHVPLPENAGPATVMAIGYYVIGQIQKQHPAYFKQHIEQYVKDASEIFGTTLKPIVE